MANVAMRMGSFCLSADDTSVSSALKMKTIYTSIDIILHAGAVRCHSFELEVNFEGQQRL